MAAARRGPSAHAAGWNNNFAKAHKQSKQSSPDRNVQGSASASALAPSPPLTYRQRLRELRAQTARTPQTP